jgi:hypothetical protein
MRTINIYWDIVKRHHLDVSGNFLKSSLTPFVHANENVLLNILLVTDAALTPYAVTDYVTLDFTAVLDIDYVHDNTPLIDIGGSEINKVGDWNGGNANPAVGQISIRVNAASAALIAELGNDTEAVGAELELDMWNKGDGSLSFTTRFPLRTLNLMDRSAL